MLKISTVLLLLLLLLVFAMEAECRCADQGWIEINGKCFRAFRQSAISQAAAQRNCTNQRGDLASIHNAAEDYVIRGLIAAAVPSPTAIGHFLIGMEVRRSVLCIIGICPVIGASWTDKSRVNYGQPVGTAVRGRFPWSNGAYNNGTAEPDQTTNDNCVSIVTSQNEFGNWATIRCTGNSQNAGFVCQKGAL